MAAEQVFRRMSVRLPQRQSAHALPVPVFLLVAILSFVPLVGFAQDAADVFGLTTERTTVIRLPDESPTPSLFLKSSMKRSPYWSAFNDPTERASEPAGAALEFAESSHVQVQRRRPYAGQTT